MTNEATHPLTAMAEASQEAAGEPQAHLSAVDPVRVMIDLARTNFAVYVALVSWREPALLAELRGLRHRSA